MDLQGNPNDRPRKQRGRPRAFIEKTEQNTIKSLDRALFVLEELARLEPASLSELARGLDESPATVYRVLTTFALHGIVEADEAAQTWQIGAEAFLIGSVFLRRTTLVESARPALRSLMAETGETANLGVEYQDSVLFLSQIETHAHIRAFFPPGTLSPLHASGIGKVLLASFDAAKIAKHTAKELEQFTPSTLTTLPDLMADIERINAHGYSLDDQERTIGMRCIAAPIRNAFGEVIAGISVSGPTSRVTSDQVASLAKAVVDAAAKVSATLGARPPSA